MSAMHRDGVAKGHSYDIFLLHLRLFDRKDKHLELCISDSS